MKPIQIAGENRFMSIKEIAAMLSCSVSTVRRMVSRRNISYLRVGRLRRYHFAQIVEKSFRTDADYCDLTLSGASVARFN
jgi:excisionase family DNA binding protein